MKTRFLFGAPATCTAKLDTVKPLHAVNQMKGILDSNLQPMVQPIYLKLNIPAT